MPTFAQIQAEIQNMMDIPEDELSEEQKADMAAYLDFLGQQEADKIDGFAQFMKLQGDAIENIKSESRRLADKARTMERNLERLAAHYLYTMREHGLKKVKGEVYSLSIRESQAVDAPQGEAALLELQGFNPGFVRIKTEYAADKKAIKEALKAGKIIPGCRLVTNQSLQIR